uniref:FAD-dependent oxidoreductase n=1 Tax=Angiostrongylus costaricensis TaxID=334426 RepID=A0A158PET7_ANGCS
LHYDSTTERSSIAIAARWFLKFTTSADVVICGGGISGTSVAYHLAKRGKRVCLFERDAIGRGGATGVSGGLVSAPVFWQDPACQHLAHRSLHMYTKLAQDGKFRFTRCGRVYLATSKPSEIILRRMYSRGVIHNNEIELIDCPSEMLARWPFLQTEDIQLALFSPEDVALDPVALCQELAQQAQQAGALIYENCAVDEVLLNDERQIYAVNTTNGLVETSVFVDASGIWAGRVLTKSLPFRHIQTAAYPCTYTYIHSTKLPTGAVSDTTPIFNDLDGKVMIRATGFKTLCAGFPEDGIRPVPRQGAAYGVWHHPEPDWDLFSSSLERLLHRCPVLGEIDHGDLICGMEAYTPDNSPTLGESSQARGYYVVNGLNGQGLSLAGGLGEILSDWICDGVPQIDVAHLDVARFLEAHANSQYLMERVPEIAALTYSNTYYTHQCHTARNLRMSPIYHQLRDAGAMFGEIMGYERPLWFEKNPKPNRNALYCGQDALIGKPVWFDCVAAEYEACRERVALVDMSSFTKFDITGSDTVKFLQYLCSANIDRPIGTTVYTGMQHERGGYVTDCTLSRLSDTRFFMIAPTIQQERCISWMKYWCRKMNVNVHIQDVTGMYTALDVVGPSSRYLMSDITEMSMSAQDFPTFNCKEISIGMATGIRAISVTHCGELGWVIYIPNEVAQNVYERVIDAGREYSLLHAGYYTLRQLRIEKFYVYWGQDINATVTPVECGRSFRVDFKKDFIGKETLEKQVERGVSRRFVQLLVDKHNRDTDPWPQGGELVFRYPVGLTTSAAYGFTLGCQVCIAYVENPEFGISVDFLNKGSYEVDIAGKRFPVRVNLHSPSLPMISSEHPLHYRPTQ